MRDLSLIQQSQHSKHYIVQNGQIIKFHKSNYRVRLRNSDNYKSPYVKDKNTFKYDTYRCFNDLPLDLRKEINNNKFISGAKIFFINKALARLS